MTGADWDGFTNDELEYIDALLGARSEALYCYIDELRGLVREASGVHDRQSWVERATDLLEATESD